MVKDITSQGSKQRLIKSELRYRRLFETAQDGILLIDYSNGRILDVNPYLIKMLGYPKSIFLKKYLWEIGIFKDIAASKNNFKTLQKKKYVRYEDLPLEAKNGKIVDVEFVSNVYKVGNETIIQCNIRNITDRVDAVKRMKNSERQFRQLFENMKSGAIIYRSTNNGKDFIIIDLNKAVEKIEKVKKKEVIGKSILKVFPGIKEFGLFSVLQRVWKTGRSVHHPILFYQDERITGWRENRVGKLPNGDIFTIYNDLSERREMEHHIETSELRYRRLFETAKDGILLLDYYTGMIIDVNQYLIDMLGYPKSVFLKKYLWEIGAFKDIAASKENFETIQKKKYVRFEDLPLVTKKGDKVAVEFVSNAYRVDGEKIIQCNIRNITDRKKAQQETIDKVNEISLRDEAILDSIGEAVFACDRNGIIYIYNKIAEEMIGVSSKNALGKHYNKIVNFVRASDSKPGDDFIKKALEQDKITKMSAKTLLINKKGDIIPVMEVASPIKDLAGKIVGTVVVFHDVTKEFQVDKAKTEFVSLASHQLRTPLASINWTSEMLLSNDFGKITKKQKDGLEIVHSSGRRMAVLISALLNVSRLEFGTFPVNSIPLKVRKICDEVLEELHENIQSKEIKIIRDYLKGEFEVKADLILMKIICQNVIVNALRYSKPKSDITVKIDKDEHNILLIVSDHGIGIPKEEQSKVFTKLFRASNAQQMETDGTGLGLYIVKSILDATGGKIWFESVIKKGTTFYVSLPLTGMVPKKGTKPLEVMR